MFNLETAIAEWRRQIAASGITEAEVLNELETHLRDEVAGQVQSRTVSEQVAFECAVRTIGNEDALAAEFAKAAEMTKELRERRLKLFCIFGVACLYLLPFVLSIPHPWNELALAERWLGLSALALTVVSMFSGLILHRFLPVIADGRIRTRIQFASVVPVFGWLLAFAFVILPRLDLSVGQAAVVTLWAISPLAIFGGLTFGLDEAARRRTRTTAGTAATI